MLDQWTWWPEFQSWGSWWKGNRWPQIVLWPRQVQHALLSPSVCTCCVYTYVFHVHTCSAVASPDLFPHLGFAPFLHITAAKICCLGLGLWTRIFYAQRVLIRLGILHTLKEGMFRNQRSIAEGSYSTGGFGFYWDMSKNWVRLHDGVLVNRGNEAARGAVQVNLGNVPPS